jgi:hypothetical protein
MDMFDWLALSTVERICASFSIPVVVIPLEK